MGLTSQVKIVIEGDLRTGAVQVTGLIDEMRVVHWLLGEALRICVRRANQRSDANGQGPKIMLVEGSLPPHPPA